MFKMRNRFVASIMLPVLIAGCDEGQRLVEQAREADERQAEQNRQIAHQNHELAEATNKLIEADAKSREELVALERDLQAERAAVGRQRDALEAERKQMANQRRQESMWAECIGGAAALLACLLPLMLCWRLLAGWRDGGSDEALGELLAIELAGDSALPLLPAPNAQTTPAEGRLSLHQDGDGGPAKFPPATL
jgi:hypothetical protein